MGRDEPGAAPIEVLLHYNVRGETLTLGAVTIPVSSPQKRNAAVYLRRPKPWVQFTVSPIVGSGDEMAREPFPTTDGLVPKAVALVGLLLRPPSALSQTKLISDQQMDVLIVLGALIALLAMSEIVVWIYASRT